MDKTRYLVDIIDDRNIWRKSAILFFVENVNSGKQTQIVWNRGDNIAYYWYILSMYRLAEL